MPTYKNRSDLQLIAQALQHYNQRFNPPRILDAVTTKKDKEKDNKIYLQTRLVELRKYIATWRNLNVITPKQEREAVLDEIEQINKQLDQ